MNEQNTETQLHRMMSKCYDMILSAEELNSLSSFQYTKQPNSSPPIQITLCSGAY